MEPSEIFSQEFIALLKNTKIDLESHLGILRSQKSANGTNEIIDEIIWLLESYLKQLTVVQEEASKENVHDEFIRIQLRSNIEKELIGNFRIPSVAALIGSERWARRSFRNDFHVALQIHTALTPDNQSPHYPHTRRR